jgi:hypothetical protein
MAARLENITFIFRFLFEREVFFFRRFVDIDDVHVTIWINLMLWVRVGSLLRWICGQLVRTRRD